MHDHASIVRAEPYAECTQIFNALNYYYCKMFIVEDKIF